MKTARVRDSQKSREDILNAAEMEFSDKGIYGTRIDEIAARANINKRMIYEYFGNKEELYKAVLSSVYGRLSRKEFDLLSEHTSCTDAIKRIIQLQFEFLRDSPTYVNLILWENLNKGKYINQIDFSGIKDPTLELLASVIDRGKAEGVFKPEINTKQVILSILTHTFSYYSNRYTLSKLLSMDMGKKENIKLRADIVTDMFLGYLCK
ncbi:MAG: TetR/AcrR family transcriptional regulator [Clostridiaceae bacterium]